MKFLIPVVILSVALQCQTKTKPEAQPAVMKEIVVHTRSDIDLSVRANSFISSEGTDLKQLNQSLEEFEIQISVLGSRSGEDRFNTGQSGSIFIIKAADNTENIRDIFLSHPDIFEAAYIKQAGEDPGMM